MNDQRPAIPVSGWRGAALLPVLIFSALVMAVISTLGTPMVPTIAREMHVSLEAAQWLLTVTLLVGAVATPITGRLADGPWRKATVAGSLGVVCLGAVLSAIGPNFAVFITGRALQGFGLGLVPLTLAVARDSLPADRLRPGIAILSITTAVGAGLGYPITGLIAESLDYRAGFWFAAVVSAIAVTLVLLVVPSASGLARRPLDGAGGVLLSLALLCLLLVISQGQKWGWESGQILLLATGAVLCGALWVAQELRASTPLIDLRLVVNRTVLNADLTALLMGVGLYAMSSLVNRYVQAPAESGYGFHSGLVGTGFILMPLSVGSLLSNRLTIWIGRRFGGAIALPAGAVIVAADMVFLAARRESIWEVALAVGILGFGIGITFAAMPAMIFGAVPPGETGSAMSLNAVLRSVGGAIGSAASIALLSAFTPAGEALPTNHGYSVTFLAGAAICVVCALVSIALMPRAVTARAPMPVASVALEEA